MTDSVNPDDLRACVPEEEVEGNYGTRILREILERIKTMTDKEYDAIYASVKDCEDMQVVFPDFDEHGKVIAMRTVAGEFLPMPPGHMEYL